MWSIGFLAVIWIAATIMAKMAGNGTTPGEIKAAEAKVPEEQKSAALETSKLKLDALKAIRESAFQRWDKRRGYEWQLSISIWTALAAFSGLVLNKDFPIQNQKLVALIVAAAGIAIVGGHGYYLWKMFEHTIGDAGILRWAEKEMFKVAFAPDKESSAMPDFIPLAPPKNTKTGHDSDFLLYPNLSRYGVVQAGITLVLVMAAIGAVLAARNPAPSAIAPSTNYYIEK